ncbi:MAG: dockerin type I repeat-containing protein [Clostridia bacterium]|nr:dockerin type I repeat-containing protein [Clostridia bacterium]
MSTIKRIISLAVSVCMVFAMFSVCVVANANEAINDVQIVLSTDAVSIDNNGTVELCVSLDNYGDYILGNKVLAAAVINIGYDESAVTPDIDNVTVADSVKNNIALNADDGNLTFVLTGDNSNYITADQLNANNGVLFTVSFAAKGIDTDAVFSVNKGLDTSATSLAVLDLDVVAGGEGTLITDASVAGIDDCVSVQIGEGDAYVYQPQTITVTMVDANGTNGYWYAPDSDGPFYVGDRVVFNTAYASIYLDGTKYDPWTAYFTLQGGNGSYTSAGNIQLYVGAGGGGITLDKSGVWELSCSNNSIHYSLMTIEVYPTPTQDDVNDAKLFDETVSAFPDADEITLDDEDAVLAACELYEALSPAALTFITEEEKYIAVYEAYLTLKYGSVGRAKAYEVIAVITELPEPGDVTLSDEDVIFNARNVYTLLNDEYKGYVENYKKLLACESALDAIYVPRTITYAPGDTSATSTGYVSFSSNEFHVSDSLKNNAWWINYTFNYTDKSSGITYSGKIYNAYYVCESAGINQNAQVGYGKSTGTSDNAYTLSVAGEWIFKGTIEDSANGYITVELARFSVGETPYGNQDNDAANNVINRINNLPEKITYFDIDAVYELKADYDALIRYDLVSDELVAKLNAAVAAADRALNIVSDVNSDGVVDAADLLLIQNMIVGQCEVVEGADVDGDGKVNALDLLKLQQHILGYSLLF